MAFLARLSARERKFLFLSLFILALALLDHFIVKPTQSVLNQINNDIMICLDDLKTDYIYLKYKDNILTNYNEFVRYKAPVASSTEISRHINRLATDAQVSNVDIKPEESSREGKTIIPVTCVGKPEEIIKFLYNISTSELLLKLEKVELGLQKRGSAENLLNCSLIISQTVLPR